jgi:hypothetical protein
MIQSEEIQKKVKKAARQSNDAPAIPTTGKNQQPTAASILPKLVKVLTRPGIDRAKLFLSATGRPVFAYSVYAEDTSKLVREDIHGNRTVGRFVKGRFRANAVRSKV